jgi:arylsulfatase A-like enzyme
MVEAVDGSVGQIMDAIKRLGLDENTFVFFTSDNGGYLDYGGRYRGEISSNGPLRGQKGNVFEGGHRVPAIARWPGRIKAGTVASDTAMTMDLMPTYLELAGAKAAGLDIHDILDGRTLAPVLFERESIPERTLFWRSGREWAVRRGLWKLVRDEDGQTMLFNLEDDIGEEMDLAKEKPEFVGKLLAAYRDWEKDVSGKKWNN